jgi:DNA-binding transcriptional regulator YiaG
VQMTKTSQMRCIEAERGQSMESIISVAIESGVTWEELAMDLGITRYTLRDWARKLRLRVVTTRKVVQDQARVRA